MATLTPTEAAVLDAVAPRPFHDGLDLPDLAAQVFGTDHPSPVELAEVRRAAIKLARQGLIYARWQPLNDHLRVYHRLSP